MGDEFEIPGQAGAVGKDAHSHDNTFNKADTIIINQAATVRLSSLHQLPPPPHGFVVRKKEMRELLKALEKRGATISGLQGMGGIGKTALALKLAEQLKPQYPDAQFYLDLKGASKEPLTARDALEHVIRSFHPDAKLSEDESGLRGLYNSLLEGKRTLLLMDNAASAEQVKPLIPPTGSIMLVTSRSRFFLSGFFVKNLDMLEQKDAEQLLLKIAPRIGNYAVKIAERCGYLPLALELAASALLEYINLTPDEYVELLSNAATRLDFVEASLSLSYELLSDELKKLWRVLSVFPNTFDDKAVAALWGIEVKAAKFKLGKLISYSLIEWNETRRRYRLHDLLKLLADEKLEKAEKYSAGKLHAIYYRDVLAQACKLYDEGNDKVIQGLSLFDLERENIERGQIPSL